MVQPIYVGRARLTKSSGPRPLFTRLQDHAESIQEAENIRVEDFFARFLVLNPVWVSTVEDLLVPHFDPLWNTKVTGFGNHSPGGGRAPQKMSRWDVLHPGRGHQKTKAALGSPAPSEDEVKAQVETFRALRDAKPEPERLTPQEVQLALIHRVPDK
jgi:hypothetical protein